MDQIFKTSNDTDLFEGVHKNVTSLIFLSQQRTVKPACFTSAQQLNSHHQDN